MKKLLPLLLTALFVLGARTTWAQTADHITYDIVYDVSGSVPIFDPNNNLRFFLDRMLKIAGGNKIGSYADFHLYFIGGRRDSVLDKRAFLTIQAGDPKLATKIIAAIKKQTDSSRHQQYTYLHTALELISDTSKKAVASRAKTAGGVFIFSDGIIGEQDLDTAALKMDLPHYLAGVNQRIAYIQQALHKPVFLIQSYVRPQNSYAMIPDSSKYPNVDKTLQVTPNWFWLLNDWKADTSQIAAAAFDKFINKANLAIVTANQLPAKKDTIATSIKLDQLLTMLGTMSPEKVTGLVNKLFPVALAAKALPKEPDLLKTSLLQVITLAGKNHYTKDEIKTLQDAIRQLSGSPEVLRELQQKVASDSGVTLSLTGDQLLNTANFPAVKADINAVKSDNSESLEAKILNGIAKYLVNRVKQEIAYYFIDEVNVESLNAKYKIREIGMFLLPNTKEVIRSPANYTDINAIRTALLKDVGALPDNLAAHPELFGRSEGLVALRYFYLLYSHIRQTNSLEQSFTLLAADIEKQLAAAATTVNYAGGQATVSRIEQSLLFTARLVSYLKNHDLSGIYVDQQPDKLTKLVALLSVDSKYIGSIQQIEKMGSVINNVYLKYIDLKQAVANYQPTLKAPATGNILEYQANQFAALNQILSRISDLMLAGSPVLELMKFDDAPVLTAFTSLREKISRYGQGLPFTLNGQAYLLKFTRGTAGVSLAVEDSAAPGMTIAEAKDVKNGKLELNISGTTYRFGIVHPEDISDPAKALDFLLEPVASILARFDTTFSGKVQDLTKTIQGHAYTLHLKRDGKNVILSVSDAATPEIHGAEVPANNGYGDIQFGGMHFGFHVLNYADISDAAKDLQVELEPLADALAGKFDRAAAIRSAENCLQAYFLFRDHKYADAVNLLLPDLNLALRDRFGSDTIALQRINTIFRIAGGVVSATSSDDIETIIAKNALPAGSYKDKRNSPLSFYLNAYAGGALTNYTSENKIRPGLFAPVGFEYAWGRIGKSKHYQSLGILLSIIEVGNIINYQLANRGADQTDVAALSRAFAPGLYATYGMSNHFPFSILAGYQMNPGRVNVGICFDLPLTPIVPFLKKH